MYADAGPILDYPIQDHSTHPETKKKYATFLARALICTVPSYVSAWQLDKF